MEEPNQSREINTMEDIADHQLFDYQHSYFMFNKINKLLQVWNNGGE